MEDVESAKAESDVRRQRSREFTQASKEKSQRRKEEAQERLSRQKEKMRLQIKKRMKERKIAREKAAVTAHNTKKAIRGVAKAGKSMVGYVKQKLSK